MKTTKIFIVLAATATIFLTAIGVAYGYYITNQTSINANSPYTTDNGFWGLFGGCLGFGPSQPYGYQYQPPSNSTAEPPTLVPPQQPYQPQGQTKATMQTGMGVAAGAGKLPFFFVFLTVLVVEMAVLSHISF